MNVLKSIGALIAGMMTIVLLSTLTDFALEKQGVFPPPEQGLFITWMLLLAFMYRSVYAVLGGYISGALAPANPMRHSILLGVIGTVASSIGVVVGWDLSEHWYPIALALTSLPCTWLGAKLKLR